MGGHVPPEATRMIAEAVKAQALLAEIAAPTTTLPSWALWQPIETAPKDGSRILAFGKIGFEGVVGIGTVKWCAVYCQWEADPSEATEYSPEACELSHWMPLPEAPE